MNRFRCALIVAVIVCFVSPRRSYAQVSDSLKSDTLSVVRSSAAGYDTYYRCEYKFNPKQLIVPSILIAVGAAGVADPHLLSFRDALRDEMAGFSRGRRIHIDDYIQYLPVAAHLGLGCAGVETRNPFRERFMAALTSLIVMAAMVNALKYSVREGRPATGYTNSFPSGHTATAFMGAELVRMEYHVGVSIGAYSVAILTGLLRIYNDRHWINDVLAGAGIGILSARIGYWMLPIYRRWFGWNRSGRQSVSAFTALPVYDPATRAFSLSTALTF